MANPQILVDWDLDNYASPHADITNYVLDFNTERRIATFEHMADDPFARLTLENVDRRFSPENYASPLFGKLRNDIPIKIIIDGVQIETFYTGSFEPTPHLFGDRVCHLYCNGFITRLRKSESSMRIYRNVKPEVVLTDVLREYGLPPIRPAIGKRIGVVGYAQIGVNSYLGDEDNYFDFETGISTIDVVGHNVKPDTFGKYDLTKPLNDIVTREMGYLYQKRDGIMKFVNRHSWVLDDTTDVTIDRSSNRPPTYTTPRQEFIARTSITCEEVTETTDSVLWSLSNPLVFGGGETKIIYAEPEDGAKKISADALSTPTGNDFQWSSGSGTVTVFTVSQKIGLKITAGEFGGTLSSLVLRGTKIETNTFSVESENNDLLGIYEPQTLTRKVPLIQDQTEAQYYSDWLLFQRSKQVGRVDDPTFIRGASEITSTSDVITTDIGAVVAFTDLQLRHYRKYRVIGITRNWQNEQLTTTWNLLPSPHEDVKIIGQSRIGIDGRLGY